MGRSSRLGLADSFVDRNVRLPASGRQRHLFAADRSDTQERRPRSKRDRLLPVGKLPILLTASRRFGVAFGISVPTAAIAFAALITAAVVPASVVIVAHEPALVVALPILARIDPALAPAAAAVVAASVVIVSHEPTLVIPIPALTRIASALIGTAV